MSRYADAEDIRSGLGDGPIFGGLYSIESEEALVGAALVATRDCEEAFELVRGSMFGHAVLGKLFDEAHDLHKAGRAVSPAMLRDRMGVDEDFVSWGGVARLLDFQETSSAVGIMDHAKAVQDRATRREIHRLATTTAAKAVDTSSGEADVLLADLERGATEIARGAGGGEDWMGVGELIDFALDQAEARSGRITYPTGIVEVDEMLGGLHPGETTIIGGRTGMAKTTVAGTVALANGRAGLGTCVFSLEMAPEPMGIRMACDVAYTRGAIVYSLDPTANTNPSVSAVMANKLGRVQRERLREAACLVRDLPLVFDTTSALTMAQIEARVRRQHRRWARNGIKPGPVIIDHLGKVKPQKDRRGDKRLETADASNDAMEMAKRLGVPVVLVAQLNREVEKRGSDKRPGLADLREAGQLEEDARQVILLYRPEYYLRPPEDADSESDDERQSREKKALKARNKLIWLVRKNSHGPVGEIETFCDVACSAVRDKGQAQ